MNIDNKQTSESGSALYNLDILVNINPENYLPYEISYEISITNHRFKKRIESLEAQIAFTRSLLFFNVSTVRVIEKKRLDTISFDSTESLLLNKKVVYRESNERVALKLHRRLEYELKHYLDYESHIFQMLLNSEKKYRTTVRSS